MRLAIAIILAFTASALGGELKPKPGSENPVNAGQLVWIDVTGITPEQLKTSAMHNFPRDGVLVVPGQTWTGTPYLLFQATGNGHYMLAVCVAVDGKVVTVEYIVIVGDGPKPPTPPTPPTPPQPDISGLALSVYQWAGSLPGGARSECPAVASAFEAIASRIAAGTLRAPAEIVAATQELNRKAVSDRDVWLKFFTPLQARLNEYRDAGKLTTPEQHKAVWLEIARGLEAVK